MDKLFAAVGKEQVRAAHRAERSDVDPLGGDAGRKQLLTISLL